VLLVGLLAVALAVSATPVGEQWAAELRDAAEPLLDRVQGLFS
jgi:hypothetical protein